MEKNCLNCKEWPTYGTVCNPFDEDPAKHSCSGHTLDRNLMLKMMTALEAENVRLKIAHLRRMADRADMLATTAEMPYYARFEKVRIAQRLRRFHVACLAKITELKGSQR